MSVEDVQFHLYLMKYWRCELLCWNLMLQQKGSLSWWRKTSGHTVGFMWSAEVKLLLHSPCFKCISCKTSALCQTSLWWRQYVCGEGDCQPLWSAIAWGPACCPKLGMLVCFCCRWIISAGMVDITYLFFFSIDFHWFTFAFKVDSDFDCWLY